MIDMNNFTLCLLLLLIISIINNLIIYSSYIYSYSYRDPLLPDNIGVIHYDIYYNINHNTNKEKSGILKTNYKYKINEYMNKLQKNNIQYLYIKDRNLELSDYNKIIKLSQINE